MGLHDRNDMKEEEDNTCYKKYILHLAWMTAPYMDSASGPGEDQRQIGQIMFYESSGPEDEKATIRRRRYT